MWTTNAPAEAGLYYVETIDGDVLELTAEALEGKWGKIRLRWLTVPVAADEFKRFLRIPGPNRLAALLRLAEAALTIAVTENPHESMSFQAAESSFEAQEQSWEKVRDEYHAALDAVKEATK